MTRRVIVGLALILGVLGMAGAAHAGIEEYPPPTTPTTTVAVDAGDVTPATTAPAVAAAADTTGTLPQTGSDGTETLVRVGVVLLAAGGLLAFAARRRSVAASR